MFAVSSVVRDRTRVFAETDRSVGRCLVAMRHALKAGGPHRAVPGDSAAQADSQALLRVLSDALAALSRQHWAVCCSATFHRLLRDGETTFGSVERAATLVTATGVERAGGLTRIGDVHTLWCAQPFDALEPAVFDGAAYAAEQKRRVSSGGDAAPVVAAADGASAVCTPLSATTPATANPAPATAVTAAAGDCGGDDSVFGRLCDEHADVVPIWRALTSVAATGRDSDYRTVCAVVHALVRDPPCRALLNSACGGAAGPDADRTPLSLALQQLHYEDGSACVATALLQLPPQCGLVVDAATVCDAVRVDTPDPVTDPAVLRNGAWLNRTDKELLDSRNAAHPTDGAEDVIPANIAHARAPLALVEMVVARAGADALNACDPATADTPLCCAVRHHNATATRALLARVPDAVDLFATTADGHTTAAALCPEAAVTLTWRAAECRQREYLHAVDRAVRVALLTLPGCGKPLAPFLLTIVAYVHDRTIAPDECPAPGVWLAEHMRERLARASVTATELPAAADPTTAASADANKGVSAAAAAGDAAAAAAVPATPVPAPDDSKAQHAVADAFLAAPTRALRHVLERALHALPDPAWQDVQTRAFHALLRRGDTVSLRHAASLAADVCHALLGAHPYAALQGACSAATLQLWCAVACVPDDLRDREYGDAELHAAAAERRLLLSALLDVLMRCAGPTTDAAANAVRARALNGRSALHGTVLDAAVRVVKPTVPVHAELLLELPSAYGLDVDAPCLPLWAGTVLLPDDAADRSRSDSSEADRDIKRGDDDSEKAASRDPAAAAVAVVSQQHHAIATAMENGHTRVLIHLLQRTNEPGAVSTRTFATGESLLHQAVRLQRWEALQALLQRVPFGVDLDSDRFEGLGFGAPPPSPSDTKTADADAASSGGAAAAAAAADPDTDASASASASAPPVRRGVTARTRIHDVLAVLQSARAVSGHTLATLRAEFSGACARQDEYVLLSVATACGVLMDVHLPPVLLHVVTAFITDRPVG